MCPGPDAGGLAAACGTRRHDAGGSEVAGCAPLDVEEAGRVDQDFDPLVRLVRAQALVGAVCPGRLDVGDDERDRALVLLFGVKPLEPVNRLGTERADSFDDCANVGVVAGQRIPPGVEGFESFRIGDGSRGDEQDAERGWEYEAGKGPQHRVSTAGGGEPIADDGAQDADRQEKNFH